MLLKFQNKKKFIVSYQLAIYKDASNNHTLWALTQAEMNQSYESVDEILGRIFHRIEILAAQTLSVLSLKNLASKARSSLDIPGILRCLNIKTICTAFESTEVFIDKFLLNRDDHNNTALFYLTFYPELHPILFRLLDLGFISKQMLSHKNDCTHNVLMIAAEQNLVTLLDRFFQSQHFSQDLLLEKNREKNTLLQIACLVGNVESVQYILDSPYMCKGLLFNQNSSKKTLLMQSIQCRDFNKSIQMLNAFLASDFADEQLLLKKDIDGSTVLSLFCKWNLPDFVEIIINSRHYSPELLSGKSDFGSTALDYALSDMNILQMLLRSKGFAKERLLDFWKDAGSTIMVSAIRRGDVDAIAMILNHYPEIAGQLLSQRGSNNLNPELTDKFLSKFDNLNAFEASLICRLSVDEKQWFVDNFCTEIFLTTEVLLSQSDYQTYGRSHYNLLLLAYYKKDRNLLKKILLMPSCTSQVLSIQDSNGMSLAMYATDDRDFHLWNLIFQSPGYSKEILAQRDLKGENCASRLMRTGMYSHIETSLSSSPFNLAFAYSFKTSINALKASNKIQDNLLYQIFERLFSSYMKRAAFLEISPPQLLEYLNEHHIELVFGSMDAFVQKYFISEIDNGDRLLSYLCSNKDYHLIVARLFEIGGISESMLLHQNVDGENALMILLKKKTLIDPEIILNANQCSDKVLNLRDSQGENLLQIAARLSSNNINFVQYIVKHRLSESLLFNANNQGETIVMLLIKGIRQDQWSKERKMYVPEIIDSLLHSDYVNETFLLKKENQEGLTALSLFCKLGLKESVQALVNVPACTSKVLSQKCIQEKGAIAHALKYPQIVESLIKAPNFSEKHLLELQGNTIPMIGNLAYSIFTYACIHQCDLSAEVILKAHPDWLKMLLKKAPQEIVVLMKKFLLWSGGLKEYSQIFIQKLKDMLFTEEFLTSEILQFKKESSNLPYQEYVSNILFFIYDNIYSKETLKDLLKKILRMQSCTSEVLNVEDEEGYTLAMRTTQDGKDKLLKSIFASPGFSIEVLEKKDSLNQENLLMHAMQRMDLIHMFEKILDFILKRDIDLLLEKNKGGDSIFAMAFKKKSPYPHLKLLLERVPWDRYERIQCEIQEVFFNLCLNRHHDNKIVEIIEYLPLKLLFQIRNQYGYTALSVAIQSGHLGLIKAIFVKCDYQSEAKNMMNLVDNQQKNAWVYAKENNLENQIKSLLGELSDSSLELRSSS